MGVFSGLIDLLFPPKCAFCGKVADTGADGLCTKCGQTLPYTKDNERSHKGRFYDECVAPLRYEGNVRQSILRFKFKGAVSYTDVYGRLMAGCIRDTLAGKYDLITWAPLSPKRARNRGYDQAMLLAYAVALELDDVAVETLDKRVNVQAQSSITDKYARRANISGAYTAKDPELVAGKRVLLIDDIVTTGSTLSECARILLMAGAESVVCAVLARTI